MRDHWLRQTAVRLCRGHSINKANTLRVVMWHLCDSCSRGLCVTYRVKGWRLYFLLKGVYVICGTVYVEVLNVCTAATNLLAN